MESSLIVKKKRTKRQRIHLSPTPAQPATSSSTSTCEFSEITSEDEEDMANCLILLAQEVHKSENMEPNSASYECKTCNKCFPTFQALGGHRASHKKPKLSISSEVNEASIQLSMNSFSVQVAAKARIHECSICGRKFSSGQALGGHKRRHRPWNSEDVAKKEGNLNGLSLDLNLPPPFDDEEDIV